jgi:hypothetical protein
MAFIIRDILTLHHFCQDNLTQAIKNGGGESTFAKATVDEEGEWEKRRIGDISSVKLRG